MMRGADWIVQIMMRYSRLLAPVFVAVALLLAACDRPTEPQARDAVEKVQQRVLSVAGGLDPMFEQSIVDALERTSFFPRDSIEIERNGETERFVATVMERVYFPPASSGGGPYIRRTLLAWDRAARRGIALASDDNVSTIVFPSRENIDENNVTRIWGQLGFATELEHDRRDGWFGTEGGLAFQVGPVTGACSLRQHEAAPRDPCQVLRYSVEGSATIEHHGANSQPQLHDLLAPARMLLRMRMQDVPGTRIITHCPELAASATTSIMACTSPWNFWRDQSRFASELGVDVTRLKRQSEWGPVHQTWIAGSGPTIDCCLQFQGRVRYTVFTPDGKMVRRVESVAPSADSALKRVQIERVIREGSRILVLLPARIFDPAASYAAIHVLDMSLLPCPTGLKRNDTSFMGNAYPDGGCYPWANYPKP